MLMDWLEGRRLIFGGCVMGVGRAGRRLISILSRVGRGRGACRVGGRLGRRGSPGLGFSCEASEVGKEGWGGRGNSERAEGGRQGGTEDEGQGTERGRREDEGETETR